MKTNLKTILFALGFTALGAGLTVSTHAMARGGDMHSRSGSQHRMAAQLFRDLDLTSAQKVQLMEIKDGVRAGMEGRHDQRSADLRELSTLLESPKKNREQVHALIDGRVDQMAETIHDTADELLDFVQGLDKEQQANLRAKLDEVADRVEERPTGHSE